MTDTSPFARSENRSIWDRLRRWSGLPPEAGGDPVPESAEEAIAHDERVLIENVLRLKSLAAWDVMVPRVDITAIDVDTPFPELVRHMAEEGQYRLPACEAMVPRPDIPPIVADTPLPELVRHMVEEGHSRLPVYKDDLDHII